MNVDERRAGKQNHVQREEEGAGVVGREGGAVQDQEEGQRRGEREGEEEGEECGLESPGLEALVGGLRLGFEGGWVLRNRQVKERTGEGERDSVQ